ncbi:molybdopterin-guanine dinucleotide biosynthesis protein B [Aquabacterium sp. A7-Y]|uniref:molybdopterin-guanine dinucleotide biosynthesis protein B n=1 Tax=Aquabacterium sp. A7-Y TaxID=1349605 RepID=UPI00223D3681|nr:molybdopterin-guanine dinucleotide biosynthesis protein B [Aquabacterium sp. A7-Y]MCW7541321.1 molybdopterin-guanine dinucleotide biosynthesis protein B [Aquabacterium sp. A7-Y]
MKVLGFCGYSGAGKTTLLEQLIPRLRAAGARVSVVKHAHHRFDIDQPGKDSWRHRQAGAFEVVIASDRRLAKIREYEVEAEPTVHQLIAELSACDWVLVEGFKRSALPRIEVWRASTGHPALHPEDPWVVAVATDDRAALPQPTALPVLDLNDPDAVVAHLLQNAARYEYRPPPDDAEPGRGPGPAARPPETGR